MDLKVNEISKTKIFLVTLFNFIRYLQLGICNEGDTEMYFFVFFILILAQFLYISPATMSSEVTSEEYDFIVSWGKELPEFAQTADELASDGKINWYEYYWLVRYQKELAEANNLNKLKSQIGLGVD